MEKTVVIRWLAASAVFWLISFVLTGTVAATESAPWHRLEIPASVAVRETVAATPAEWRTVMDDRPHIPACATFFDGPPEKQASLVYEHETRHKNRIVRTWRFYDDWKDGAWLQICYSATAATLARQLPHGTTQCRVEFDATTTVDGYEQINSIECR